MKETYIIYKITNTVNNKIYIGKHKTSDIDDGYFGSGTVLKRAIKKYGIDKFKKEIIYTFDNEEEMNQMEAKIVNEDFLLREDVYNIKLGGAGGFDYINKNGLNNTGNQYIKAHNTFLQLLEDDNYFAKWKEKIKLSQSIAKKNGWDPGSGRRGKPGTFTGLKHTEEAKRKVGEANAIYQRGEKNSQYGTCWIYNLTEKKSIKIKKQDLSNWLSKGWKAGRKIKF